MPASIPGRQTDGRLTIRWLDIEVMEWLLAHG